MLVDLDLRSLPSIDSSISRAGRALTNVALGEVSLDEAIKHVAVEPEVTASRRGRSTNIGGNGNGGIEGVLELLLSGPPPPAAGEFVASEAVGEILDELRERADLVLVDAPPLLQVGEAIALTARVDALFVVTRLKMMRRPALKELARVLETCPAEKLGFVVTGAKFEEGYGYAGYRRDERRAGRRASMSPEVQANRPWRAATTQPRPGAGQSGLRAVPRISWTWSADGPSRSSTTGEASPAEGVAGSSGEHSPSPTSSA